MCLVAVEVQGSGQRHPLSPKDWCRTTLDARYTKKWDARVTPRLDGQCRQPQRIASGWGVREVVHMRTGRG